MDIFTHLVFGALTFNLFQNVGISNYLLLILFFSILPDLDIFITPLKRKFKSNYLEHRSGSHSYIIGLILSIIICGIFSIITSEPFLIAWVLGIFFYGIHISLDLLNTTKIPCFYPISKKEYCFYVEKAGSSFTLLTSWIFIISLLVVFNNFPSFFLAVINIYTNFTIFYYLYRILTKIWINSHLKENQKYFPGVLPFCFVIFEKEIIDNNLSLLVERKSHFSKSKLIHKSKSILTPQEMIFFKEGIEMYKENYYFSKWTVLPIFIRTNDVFSIKFFFLEPMVHSRAMYIQYNFDMNSRKIISNDRSFGHI
ncbi:MAG: metal-dependent hydrolase [Candidatus Lokiarchaeota archaeon]|nr:metal-dependent hydrolase [Candidatus Lokiarchaeota archaeon]